MKTKYFPLLVTSIMLVGVSPVLSAPAQLAPTVTSDIDQLCQQYKYKAAVVTLYVGTEIGSGSIISDKGIVITNKHVIAQAIKEKRTIYINLQNGKNYEGKFLKADPNNDLALVKITTNPQKPETFEQIVSFVRDQAPVGEPVCAIGSPYNQPGTVTLGEVKGSRGNDLVSAVKLNPGNSGGPLLNSQGKIVGVNKSIWYLASGKNSGTSFAVSAASALKFIEQFTEQSGIRVLPNQSIESTIAPQPLSSIQPKITQIKRLAPSATMPIPESTSTPALSVTPITPVVVPQVQSSSTALDPSVPSYVVPVLPLTNSAP